MVSIRRAQLTNFCPVTGLPYMRHEIEKDFSPELFILLIKILYNRIELSEEKYKVFLRCIIIVNVKIMKK